MKTILVNPLDETPRLRGRPAARLESLAGKTIGLLDISKPGSKIFLDTIERLLKERYGVGQVVRQTKATFTKPASEEAIQKLLLPQPHGVIEVLAD